MFRFHKKKSPLDDVCYIGIITEETNEDGEKEKYLYVGPIKKDSGYSLTGVKLDGYVKYKFPEERWEPMEKVDEGKEDIKLRSHGILANGELIRTLGEDKLDEVLDYFKVEITRKEIKEYKKALKEKEKKEKLEEKAREREIKGPITYRIKESLSELKDETHHIDWKYVGREVVEDLKYLGKGMLGVIGFLNDWDKEDKLYGEEKEELSKRVEYGVIGNFVISWGGAAGAFAADPNSVVGATLIAWPVITLGGELAVLATIAMAADAWEEIEKQKEEERRKARIRASVCEDYIGK